MGSIRHKCEVLWRTFNDFGVPIQAAYEVIARKLLTIKQLPRRLKSILVYV